MNHDEPLLGKISLQLFSLIRETVQQVSMTCLYYVLSDDAKLDHCNFDCQMREPSQLAVDIHRAEERWCWNECEWLINETIK